MCTAYADRDPTQPPDTTPSVILGSDLQIDAIFFNKEDSSKSIVIIEGRHYTTGDKVMDVTITEIKPHEITLRGSSDGDFIVAIPYSDIKTPTTKNKKKNT